MSPEDLKQIICLLENRDILELAIERGNESLRIKRSVGNRPLSIAAFPSLAQPANSAPPLAVQAGNSAGTSEAGTTKEELHFLKSSTVGIFRESKSNGEQPLAPLGAMVEAGQTVGFIEVLRLLSDVQSNVTGEIAKKMVSHGEPVEYGQVLFAIRPRK